MKICPTPNAESPAEIMEEISRGDRGDFGKDQSSPVKTSSSASFAPPRESSDIARYKDPDHTDGFNPVEFDGIRMQAGLNSFILTADERTPRLQEGNRGK